MITERRQPREPGRRTPPAVRSALRPAPRAGLAVRLVPVVEVQQPERMLDVLEPVHGLQGQSVDVPPRATVVMGQVVMHRTAHRGAFPLARRTRPPARPLLPGDTG